jgi:hypothetical protein
VIQLLYSFIQEGHIGLSFPYGDDLFQHLRELVVNLYLEVVFQDRCASPGAHTSFA